MTLIKSISGIRGTIGGSTGENLTPADIVKFCSAYGEWIKRRNRGESVSVVTGRDARVSGRMVSSLVSAALNGMGINVTDLGLATTPTVEIAVMLENAQGGIIISASHNPWQWNALKLLKENGEFLNSDEGGEVLDIAGSGEWQFSPVEELGICTINDTYLDKHIDMILSLPLVNSDRIRQAGFTVAIDCVNSVGGIALPLLLERLGVERVIELYTGPTGIFPHNPEPLPGNITDLSSRVVETGADVGFVVDPDVDRLAIVCEDGSPFNEEYTLVACADYILGKQQGDTVSNMSSSRALRDITMAHGGRWYYSEVGEVNVVEKMKQVNAVIGGEGNGGIIYPPLHFGRDALVGIALFLSHLAESSMKCTELRYRYPNYHISKNRIELPQGTDPDQVMDELGKILGDRVSDRGDGLLMETGTGWVLVRKSNTEPILRVYSEAPDPEIAEKLSAEIIKIVKNLSSETN